MRSRYHSAVMIYSMKAVAIGVGYDSLVAGLFAWWRTQTVSRASPSLQSLRKYRSSNCTPRLKYTCSCTVHVDKHWNCRGILLRDSRQAEDNDEKRFASTGGSVRPVTRCRSLYASTGSLQRIPKMNLIIELSRRTISEIKLKRTDTTLDLSQKAKRAEEGKEGMTGRPRGISTWGMGAG